MNYNEQFNVVVKLIVKEIGVSSKRSNLVVRVPSNFVSISNCSKILSNLCEENAIKVSQVYDGKISHQNFVSVLNDTESLLKHLRKCKYISKEGIFQEPFQKVWSDGKLILDNKYNKSKKQIARILLSSYRAFINRYIEIKLDVLNSFGKWYKNYFLIENIDMLLDLVDKIEKDCKGHDRTITVYLNDKRNCEDRCNEIVDFLERQNAIENGSDHYDTEDNKDGTVNYLYCVDVKLSKLRKFKEKIRFRKASLQLMQNKNDNSDIKSNIRKNKDNILYKLEIGRYSGLVTVNGIKFRKYNYESDNHKIFEYLLSCENKQVSKKDLETIIGKKIDDLSKQISNLGFTHESRKILIESNSNEVILFNPITKDRFNDICECHRLDPKKAEQAFQKSSQSTS